MMTASEHLHARLVGKPGSRDRLNTPALVLDLDVFEANVAAMATFARAHNLALRPHAKTHKSADVARAQIGAGAVGLCCAKLGEAEALAVEGIDNLHLTSPIVTAPAIERLVALNKRSAGLSVVADHPCNVDALAAAARDHRPLRVLVDIDPGIRRTGVASLDDAVALARRIAGHPSLAYGGVQFYCGVQQHIASYSDRRAAIADRTAYLRSIIDALTAEGLAPAVVTGGGTGTHAIDAELGVLTELQAGSYIFMDREYGDCALTPDGEISFTTALMVDARVISANAPGMATIDAGLKAFSTDAGPPPVLDGADRACRYIFMGDEHGAIAAPDGHAAPPLGTRVTLATPHCDPTVNLYDSYHVVRGNTLVAIWPITARGRSA
jgi:D-serine deaminase-like pyridoxal phosphate-dependent protein